MDGWQAWTTTEKLFFELTTQKVPGGSRVLHTWLLNLRSAHGLFSDERLERIDRWTNPKRFTVEINQTIAAPPPAE